MDDNIYKKLATVLDTLPNGFPETENGVEITLLKKIFTPDEADLFCDLKLNFENALQIAQRTGRPLDGLEEKLLIMADKGQVFHIDFGGNHVFKMLPWAFGIYEFQLNRMDREFAELNEEFGPHYGKQFFATKPQLMQILPIETEIATSQEALPYERVSTLIDSSESFMVMECICKKEQELMDNPCSKPTEVCMAFAPIPHIFDNSKMGRAITREEAREILDKAENAGLVHMTSNFQNGRFFICNCCGCCCGVLRSINELGIPATTVVNAHYYAMIDADQCISCGICAEERCQINAVEQGDDTYHIIKDRCIGCGLCITTCPSNAIQLVRREEDEISIPVADEKEWFKKKGDVRGIDFSRYI